MARSVHSASGARGAVRLPRLEPGRPLRERVYEALEELIVYHVLEPGEHLVEAELAHRLGVSRNPVREALHMLNKDGWVDLRPRHGAFVHVPTVKEVDEVFDVRRVLEAEAARRAAGKATRESVGRLRELLAQGAEALRLGAEKELIDANSAFHVAVVETADNKTLAAMLMRLDKSVRWYFAPVAGPRRGASWEEHEQLVDAIEAGDGARAAAVMKSHTDATRRAYHAERPDAG
jgi:DNA-binding GntR family transcriptional regulator